MTTQNQGDKQFEGLLGLYLKQSQAVKKSITNQPHLDEDILSAFVEGALTERQTAPIIRHLIDCIFCRRITAQLAELSENFNEVPIITETAKANGWRELWNNLTEIVSRPHDNTVVAHEDKESNKELEKKTRDE